MSKVAQVVNANEVSTGQNSLTTRTHMKVNVILTFNTYDQYGDSQEMFDISVPVSRGDSDAVSFVMTKLFKRIEAKCEHFGRRKQELIKISTCADWALFESVTNKKSLPSLGHSCKWYFGTGRKRLDLIEKCAMAEYQFGTEADLSQEGDWFEEHIAKFLALEVEKRGGSLSN